MHDEPGDDQNQITIPPSFMALYLHNGRPIATRATIEQRYDLCEDLAIQTSDVCHTLQFKDELSEAEVLRRCRQSLEGDAVADPIVNAGEADWVIQRVAELLDWRVVAPARAER
jgi:hypothetical protein